MNSIFKYCKDITYSGCFIAKECASSTGLYYISDVAQSIFNLMDIKNIPLSNSIKQIRPILKGFNQLLDGVEIFNCLWTWVTPNHKGKMAWQRPWKKIAKEILDTAADVITTLDFLDTFRIIRIGKLVPGLNIAYTVTQIGSSIFDIENHWAKSTKASMYRENCLQRKIKWINYSVNHKNLFIDKINKWHTKTSPAASKKEAEWKQIATDCSTTDKIEAFCKKKVAKWEKIAKNQLLNQINCLFRIATVVGYVALSIFSSFLSIAFPIANAIANITVDAMYLVDFLFKQFLNASR